MIGAFYFKCKGYYAVNIVLSVKPKPKLYEMEKAKTLSPRWILIPVESLMAVLLPNSTIVVSRHVLRLGLFNSE